MAGYRFTNKAVEDLTQIWNYTINKWSENQADIYYNMILENCQELANKPSLGKDYSEITQNLLGIKAGRHIIFYRRIEGNKIEIIRILHGQMDLKKRIKEK
ncbi:MAG: type II toxin-antitoxin system RelE/ParE family toxin [Pedobacter sp.]|nr:type II toxin-antitoxin system RelE/ParE family toxin [Pedobacter sp.]